LGGGGGGGKQRKIKRGGRRLPSSSKPVPHIDPGSKKIERGRKKTKDRGGTTRKANNREKRRVGNFTEATLLGRVGKTKKKKRDDTSWGIRRLKKNRRNIKQLRGGGKGEKDR